MPDNLTIGSTAFAQPAFRTLLYCDGSLNDPENAAGVTALFDTIVAYFGEQIAWVAVADHRREMDPQEKSEAALADARAWINTPDKRFPATCRMNGDWSEEIEAVTVPHFRVDEYDFLMVELSVPHDAADRLPGFAEAVTAAAKTMPVICGVMGFGFYVPVANESLILAMPKAYARYRTAIEFMLDGPESGLRIEDGGFPWDEYEGLEPGIADIGWRTFVGAEYLPRLPDLADELKDAPGVTLEQRDGLAVITAGAAPIWGDVNMGEDIAPYRAVAAALRPVRFPIEVAEGTLFGDLSDSPDGMDRLEGYLSRYDAEV